MANTQAPFGLKPLLDGGKEARCTKYVKGSGVIREGDIVKLNNAGAIVIGTAGAAFIGVAAETRATGDTEIMVYDDPTQVFYGQADGAVAATDVGLNIDVTATATGTGPGSNQSNMDLDVASMAVTATLQFRILGLLNRGENAYGSFAMIKVRPNNHQLAHNTVGL
jgi:hypothetical protein